MRDRGESEVERNEGGGRHHDGENGADEPFAVEPARYQKEAFWEDLKQLPPTVRLI